MLFLKLLFRKTNYIKFMCELILQSWIWFKSPFLTSSNIHNILNLMSQNLQHWLMIHFSLIFHSIHNMFAFDDLTRQILASMPLVRGVWHNCLLRPSVLTLILSRASSSGCPWGGRSWRQLAHHSFYRGGIVLQKCCSWVKFTDSFHIPIRSTAALWSTYTYLF